MTTHKNLGWSSQTDDKPWLELKRVGLEIILDNMIEGKPLGKSVEEICMVASSWGCARAEEAKSDPEVKRVLTALQLEYTPACHRRLNGDLHCDCESCQLERDLSKLVRSI